MDLDFWHFSEGENHPIAEFPKIDSDILGHCRNGNNQGPVVQSIVSLASSLRGTLV